MVFSMLSVLRCYKQGRKVGVESITKLRRRQAEVTQNHENGHVRSIEQGEVRQRKYKRVNLGGGQAYDRATVVVA
jgi:hypothetical protein